MFWTIILRAIPELHEYFESRLLLEEVDADSLSYAMANMKKPELPVLPYVTGSLLISSILSYRDKMIGLSTAIGSLTLSVPAYASFRYVAVQQFYMLADACHDVQRAAKALYANLRQRDIISFGLGVTSTAQNKHRLLVFQSIREIVLSISHFSETLVNDYNLLEEKDHLFFQFFEDDMKALLNDEVTVDSVHIHDRGLGALLNLLILIRSEFCRLVIVSTRELKDSWQAISLLRKLRQFTSKLQGLMNTCNNLHITHSTIKQERIQRTNQVIKHNDLDNVANALDLIIQSIYDKKVNITEIRNAISRVLDMEALNIPKSKPPTILPEREDINESREQVLIPQLTHSTTLSEPIDQVYETIAHYDETLEAEVDELLDSYTTCSNPLLMTELRNALCERSKDYEIRERKALAAFYGVSVEDILQREVDEKAKELEKKQFIENARKEVSIEGIGECTSSIFVRPERPKMTIPDDLQKALAARIKTNEPVFGDDSDDESM